MKKVLLILVVIVLLVCLLARCSGSCSIKGCFGSAAYGEDFCPAHKAQGWKVR